MISVSEELKNAFNTGNQKDLTLYFSDNTSLTNENIVAESMSLEQILCDEEQITFGLCNSASFKITILNSNKSRVGQTVTPVITIRGTEYSMQLGVFKIVEDKVTDDRLHRNITAYDALYDIVNTDYASWYTSLTFPMTLKQFRDAFFEHIDLTQVSASLINDSMTVENTVDVDVFSGSDIIKAICELNAVFGCIDNEGHFKYIPFVHEGGLYPEEDLFPDDDLYPNDGFDVIVSGSPYSYVSGSFVYEDYVVQRITGLAIVEDESDTSELYGTDENLYMITGNYLLFGKNATDLRTVAENFLGFVGRFQYKPARIRMRAMPWVELGDIIGVVGKKGNAVFPILKRTMSGITALYDDYEAQGKEYYSFSANTVSSMVEKLKSKTMRIVANVDEISSELIEYERQTDGTLESHSSLIQQTADNITSEVQRATGAENSLSSRIIQTAESVESEVRRATGAEGNLSSRISQSAHTIDLGVNYSGASQGLDSNSNASITISLYDENGNLISSGDGNITLSGNVIFKSNLTDGTTTISGNNITTGTINANQVAVTNLNADNIISGTITSAGINIGSGTFVVNPSTGYLETINFSDIGRWIRWGKYSDATSKFEIGVAQYSTADNYAMTLRVSPVGNQNSAIRLTLTDGEVGIRYQYHYKATSLSSYAFTPYGESSFTSFNYPTLGTSGRPWGKLFSRNIIYGSVSLTPGSVGATVSTEISYNEDTYFSGDIPKGYAMASTGGPEKVHASIIAANSNATIYLNRENNVATTRVDYLVIF